MKIDIFKIYTNKAQSKDQILHFICLIESVEVVTTTRVWIKINLYKNATFVFTSFRQK